MKTASADKSLVKLKSVNAELPAMRTHLLKYSAVDFGERQKVFTLIDQLNHLCRAVQRHRGLCLGLLAGEQLFAQSFHHLRRQMAKRIELVVAFCEQSKALVNDGDIAKLYNDWNTIRDNWLDDSVLENFEFHSHFVDQLLLLVARLAKKVEQPYLHQLQSSLAENDQQPSAQAASIYEEVLAFSTRQLPQFIELLGKTRALSVHVATTGQRHEDYEKKLMYLLQCISAEKEVIANMTANFQQTLADQLPSMITVRIHEYKLNFLMEKVNSDIINHSPNPISGEEFFRLASDVIDAYWSAVDDCLGLLSLWQTRDIERWLVDV